MSKSLRSSPAFQIFSNPASASSACPRGLSVFPLQNQEFAVICFPPFPLLPPHPKYKIVLLPFNSVETILLDWGMLTWWALHCFWEDIFIKFSSLLPLAHPSKFAFCVWQEQEYIRNCAAGHRHANSTYFTFCYFSASILLPFHRVSGMEETNAQRCWLTAAQGGKRKRREIGKNNWKMNEKSQYLASTHWVFPLSFLLTHPVYTWTCPGRICCWFGVEKTDLDETPQHPWNPN